MSEYRERKPTSKGLLARAKCQQRNARTSAILAIFPQRNHVFAHAQEFDFWRGGQEFKDVRIDIELSQSRLRRPQSTLALP